MTLSRARKALLIASFALMLPWRASGTAFLHPSPQKIRVRLRQNALEVSLRGLDLKLHRLESSGHRALAASSAREGEWLFHCRAGRVSAWEKGGGKLLELEGGASVWSPSGFLRVDGRPYREEVRIFPAPHGCEVVNEVDLEKYLDGLVNSEFSSHWSEESVEAQVVAARTYALYQIGEARQELGALRKHYDVDSTVKDQVYDGSLKEDFRASRSVEKTRGLVLTVGPAGKPVPVKAFYHSTCGGMTELPEHVWGHSYAGFRRAVPCPYCVSSPRYRWKLELGQDELRQEFLRGGRSDRQARRAWGWPGDWRERISRSRLASIRPKERDSEGRVTLVSSLWQDLSGSRRLFELDVPAVRLRGWVGVGRMLSTAFEITPLGFSGRFVVSGQGSGHGVGMCQWGAKVMGERGYRMAAILKHYYPDAVLRKLW